MSSDAVVVSTDRELGTAFAWSFLRPSSMGQAPLIGTIPAAMAPNKRHLQRQTTQHHRVQTSLGQPPAMPLGKEWVTRTHARMLPIPNLPILK